MSAVATERRMRLREQLVLNTQFVVPAGAESYFEIVVGSHPRAQPTVLATRDRVVYQKALQHENDGALVDVWFIAGTPHGTKAKGSCTQIRLAESES